MDSQATSLTCNVSLYVHSYCSGVQLIALLSPHSTYPFYVPHAISASKKPLAYSYTLLVNGSYRIIVFLVQTNLSYLATWSMFGIIG